MADYKDTLNLPSTSFPMKANLAAREPEILRFWQEIGLDRQLLSRSAKRPKFILHDGPPYANGDIHVGHTLNKVLKDIIVRYRSMAGWYAPYVPGWDCHGQPIEHQVDKRLREQGKQVSQVELRRLCREYALKFVDRQRDQFQRLGIGGDWDNPYLTLDPAYEATNIQVFSEMYDKGLIYKGRKPIHWCYSCQTALAEAEIEYADESSPSIYVRFPVLKKSESASQLPDSLSVLVWTTTPWTLPANVAVALQPNAKYAAVSVKGENILVAEALIPALSEKFGEKLAVKATLIGDDLVGTTLVNPLFPERTSVVVSADFVSLEQGSGAVHIAPGHGAEDYLVGVRYDLPSPMPVDNKGVFTKDAGRYAGLHVKEADPRIIEDLRESGHLLLNEEISHSYPHCWRCKNPVIFRATEQWFVSMDQDSLRRKALAAIKEVRWIPPWSINRITGMVSERPDWCISRQRAWGVPIPVFYCDGCGEIISGGQVLGHVREVFSREGADVWFTSPVSDLLPDYRCPSCGGSKFSKETDILDVWFESGVSHEAVLRQRAELEWPADLYLEGSDQHRGWFQSSLLTAAGVEGKAPYKGVLTHGFLVDGEGRKMSKSLGNVVDPLVVIDSLGADILRLWVSSADYSSDIAISEEILQRIVEAYRRLRNTFRFLLGNLSDFSPDRDKIPYRNLMSVDKWALMRLHEVTDKVLSAYEDFKFYTVYQTIYSFATVDLSSFYLDILKDRLYVTAKTGLPRRSAQTVLYEILRFLVRLLAPVLAFTCEEVWREAREILGGPESVHLASMPAPEAEYVDKISRAEWQRILEVRDIAAKAMEEARVKKVIGNSLEARLSVTAPPDIYAILRDHETELPEIFIVSQVKVDKGEKIEVTVVRSAGEKCPRCWNYRQDIGANSHHPEICGRCAAAVESLSGA